MTPQSKSFLVLAAIAILGSFVVVIMSTTNWSSNNGKPAGTQVINYSNKGQPSNASTSAVSASSQDVTPADTTGWKEYSDSKLGIKFLYNPAWKVLPPAQRFGFTILQIDPGKKYYNFSIFISPKEYAGTEGFQAQKETISGKEGLNIQNALYAVKGSSYYYTFDLGQSQSLKPQFKALVKTVSLIQ